MKSAKLLELENYTLIDAYRLGLKKMTTRN